MNQPTNDHSAAGGSPLQQPVVRPEPERPSECGLTECRGKPMCPYCTRCKARDDGMPGDAGERHLRRLLAASVGVPGTYYDDGEAFAQAPEFGITIDFMREPVADIDAKIRALNVARAIANEAKQKQWDAFDPSKAGGDGA